MNHPPPPSRPRQPRRLSAVVVAAVTALSLITAPARACEEEAMLVFDASGSMLSNRDGTPKIDVAREAIADVLPEITNKRPTGLVTYGGEAGMSCNGIALRLPPMLGSAEMISGQLSTLVPSGSTPLTQATWTAALTLMSSKKPGIIVLMTDGQENCGYNACALGRQLAASGKPIKVHVIGYDMNDGMEANISCLAHATGGTYTSVDGLEALKNALKKTMGCPRIS